MELYLCVNLCFVLFEIYIRGCFIAGSRTCLVMLFEQQFLIFKQYNTYFYNIFSLTHIYTTLKQRY